ncbi:MAG: hypothetical protein A2Y63_02170 [Candidatus Riflebacteria bacterium RBG_13_59_9]|nr:MAG: hypothetical protein A2Y63_02170 [Candidatus Riflebacteria bacterium RBG_13_59_9]
MTRKADKPSNHEPLFTISAVAEMLNLHQQTLRKYEDEGLISPRRTAGGTRKYCRNDVERLRIILTLTRDMGVNLAGVEVVLGLRHQLSEMRKVLEFVLGHLDEPTRDQILDMMRGVQHGLVHIRSHGGLVRQSMLKRIAGEEE